MGGRGEMIQFDFVVLESYAELDIEIGYTERCSTRINSEKIGGTEHKARDGILRFLRS